MDNSLKEWNYSQIIMFSLGVLLLVGSTILFVVIATTRRRYNRQEDDTETTKHLKLPISSSDNTYTVAYQLKTGSKQPDIISRGKKKILFLCIFV